ncbi:hypothetical protein Patl1_26189 [Pistacia atlantica]|uniref:Uncharacterized protein n=1 Tax=Pistacia atlantica TaxID=434234 RepID=A0ACC1B2Y0_9ROSI|nr:hypothetical protein Patl1_26189 [Pistacia atlantica]
MTEIGPNLTSGLSSASFKLPLEGLTKEAVCALEEMKHNSLKLSLKIYNSIIHGYSRSSKFEDALFFLHEMKGIGLKPKTNTYDGLIQSYGKYKMYSKIDMCLKEMTSDGCSPDQVTYNLLIREFAQGGLLKRMEGAYKSLRSKRMHLDSSTLVAVLEAYINFGTLTDMEKVYKSLLKSNAFLKEDLIRKLAEVYIKNHMFLRLDDLGDDLASRTGRTDLVWCLRILSHACLLSGRGMDLVVQEMEDAKVPWNVSIANIILVTHLKMKDFMHLKFLFSELPKLSVKPDIVTFGILFDARRFGFDETRILVMWRRIGLLDESVKIDTDPLVLTAYGKGSFLKKPKLKVSFLHCDARVQTFSACPKLKFDCSPLSVTMTHLSGAIHLASLGLSKFHSFSQCTLKHQTMPLEENGQEGHPVAYESWKLNDTERHSPRERDNSRGALLENVEGLRACRELELERKNELVDETVLRNEMIKSASRLATCIKNAVEWKKKQELFLRIA